jgi:hypothetical protein
MEPSPPSPATPASPISAARNGVIRSNPGASLVDLGDGIGCIELHSLKNAIGGDVLSLISAVLNPAPMRCATLPASSSPATAKTSPSAPT